MELDSIFQVTRIICHFGIAITIGCYQPRGARQRWGISFLAAAIACSNAGLGMGLFTGAIEPRAFGPQVLHVGASGGLFILLLLSHGNVARFIPKVGRA
jgi:hypothetical protein